MKKKTYYDVYLNGRFSAIIKKEKDLKDFILDRSPKFRIEKKKYSPIVETYDVYAQYNPYADIVETANESRYRDMIIQELIDERKKCKKELKKIKKKLSRYKKDSHEYRGMKREHKLIEHMLDTVLDVDMVNDAVTNTIISHPSMVKEYLENRELLSMMARGEI